MGTVVGIFVQNVERSPVVSIISQAAVGVVWAQRAACAQGVREGIDVEIALKHAQSVVFALGHCAWCLLRTYVALCRKRGAHLLVNIKGALDVGR